MNNLNYLLSFGWLTLFLLLLLGLFIGWLIWGRRSSHEGDLTLEGEGNLRSENDGLRARLSELEASLSAKTSEAEGLSSQLSANATASVESGDGDDDETYALEWRNRYLAARVKYLESRLAEAPTVKKAAPKKKATAKKATAKKTATKKAPAKKKATANKTAAAASLVAAGTATRKKPGPKPGTKRGATNLDGTPRKKPGPKKGSKRKAGEDKNPNEKYHVNVRKFDAKAQTSTIDNIVKYCGISLRSRDSSLVACSDPSELQTVLNNFMIKKLEVEKEKGEKIVQDVCQEMKSERFKNRVTFYYLCAKKARKLGMFK